MHVTSLGLVDYRSYEVADLALEPGVTALVGPNGQGKTNLVEAIGYAATHDSHRVSSDNALVRGGATQAIVRVGVTRTDRDLLLEVEINPGRANRVRVNKAPSRPREAVGLLRTVLFAPEDLSLVRGDPSERRRFLDDLLVLRAPRFAGVRADYDRVLKQRNALLKSAQAARRASGFDIRTLDVWDHHLASVGAELLAGRLHLTALLTPLVASAYESVSAGQGPAALEYRPSVPLPAQEGGWPDRELLASALAAEVARVRTNEVERGVCLVGPHRDDLLLKLGEFPAKGYASHGESWSYALALRLASYELLKADGGEPVLILDDVFAELDAARRRALTRLVAPAEQVLITAAVVEDVPAELAGARFDVMGGTVTRVR